MRKTLRAGIVLLALGSGLATSLAHAEDAQAPEAETLFRHGVELMKADNCTEAVPEFLKSNALDASAATLLNLGTCYARLGRKATAWKTYQKAADAAQAEKDEALRERAFQAMAILGPTLTKVQLVTPKDSTPLSLRLNGEPLLNYDGLPIPLDPGQSIIEAAAPGKEPWRKTVTANELGATLVIQVPDLQATPEPRPVASPSPVRSSRGERDQPPDWRVPGAIVGGAGIAALVVGSVFGLSARSTYDSSQADCVGNRCTQAGIDLRDSASGKATASTVMFGVGLVAVTAGVVLWLVSPSHHGTATLGTSTSVAGDGSGWLMTVSERRTGTQ